MNISFTEKYNYEENGEIINREVKYFLAFVKNQDISIREDEIADYKWVDYNTALSLITFDEAKDILIKAKDYLDKK